MSITVNHLTKVYGTQRALDNISFEAEKGKITGFLGPNGAGKSTTMKIATGYIGLTDGSVQVVGVDVSKEPLQVKRLTGYLPENNPLYLEMYVREYLGFIAASYGLKNKKSRIEEMIEMCGLEREKYKKIEALSKGYRQRVGLAQALIHDPQVLILDEPTSGLDPNQLVDIRQLIKSLGKDKTVFLSTHIMQEVEAICDRVIIINKGKIVADKKLKDLKADQVQIIEVEFDYRVEDVLLNKLKHVSLVSNTHDFTYELTFSTKEDMRSVVFDFAHDNGLKILQLNQKNMNLESLFRELTSN